MTPFLDRDDDELGPVRLCRGCDEEWPRDKEFWYFTRTGKVLGHCRACWADRSRIGRGRDLAWGLPQRIHGVVVGQTDREVTGV